MVEEEIIWTYIIDLSCLNHLWNLYLQHNNAVGTSARFNQPSEFHPENNLRQAGGPHSPPSHVPGTKRRHVFRPDLEVADAEVMLVSRYLVWRPVWFQTLANFCRVLRSNHVFLKQNENVFKIFQHQVMLTEILQYLIPLNINTTSPPQKKTWFPHLQQELVQHQEQ